jgi:pyridinium-3,5-bisthiocarboxylic acid mononucleotide nickel chelatase
MKTAYFDAFSGLSGDMIVGAIIDCGADFGELERAIKSMPIAGYRLSTRRKILSGISALKFDVAVTEPQPERRFGEIRAMIDSSQLSTTIKKRAISIFEVLAQAEAKIHNTTSEQVHFHEVGAVDSIIDIVGTAWGLEHLGVGDVIVSPLPMGNDFARSQHGVIPVRMRWSRRPARRSSVRSRVRPRFRSRSKSKKSVTALARASWKIAPTCCG